MKNARYLFLALLLVFTGLTTKAQYSDSLRRSEGFFISPALNNFIYPDGSYASHPRFGLSAGFRFKNELKKGFFLEGGVGVTTLGGETKPKSYTYYDYYNLQTYVNKTQSEFTQINISTPFLAGYRTTHGKVRFEGSLGFAFNLKVLQYEKTYEEFGTNPHGHYQNSFHPSFGTSFSALARAGVSIPISKKVTVDILPTLRYSFLYFTDNSKNIGECIQTDLHKYSAGLDVGLTVKLDDPPVEGEQEVEAAPNNDPAYTYNYSAEQKESKPVKKKSSGKRNFIYGEILGNGMYFSNNYERTVFRKDNISIQARGGFGIMPDRFSFPIGANVALGKHRKKFEMGIGTTIENITTQDDGYYVYKAHLVPSLAYRYESADHFFLRLALMSHYFFDSGEILPGIGVSLGGCF